MRIRIVRSGLQPQGRCIHDCERGNPVLQDGKEVPHRLPFMDDLVSTLSVKRP
jgi:hypothetical protein